MKNSFLTLAFVFATAFSFAEVTPNQKLAEETIDRTCVRSTLSCGLTGWSCGETFKEIVDNALMADQMFC